MRMGLFKRMFGGAGVGHPWTFSTTRLRFLGRCMSAPGGNMQVKGGELYLLPRAARSTRAPQYRRVR